MPRRGKNKLGSKSMLERQKLVEADMKEGAQDKVNDSSFLGQANSMTPAFFKAVQRRLLHMFEASMELYGKMHGNESYIFIII